MGLKFYRRDDMDDLPNPTPLFRSDELREHVDNLPGLERAVVERIFFGGATLKDVANELGITQKTARELREAGLEQLRINVLEDHDIR